MIQNFHVQYHDDHDSVSLFFDLLLWYSDPH